MNTQHTPSVIDVSSYKDACKKLEFIECDPKSIDIMAPKMLLKIIQLENVALQDAIIIKQDMLSLGGEVAIPKDAFQLKERSASILMIGTIKQHFELVEKLNRHYPRLQKIATEVHLLLKTMK